MNQHLLEGCRTTPVSNYLKALGLFRIVSKKDPGSTACWKNDNFVLETEMSKEEIMEFLLNKYSPTPIISPWSFNKFEKTCDKLKDLIELERFESYKKTVDCVRDIFNKLCSIHRIEKISKNEINEEIKLSLLKLCRNYLPDEAVPWLDATFVIEATSRSRRSFAPILGTGANDGNFDMAENFVKCIHKIFGSGGENNAKSKEWLESALFGNVVELDERSTTGHDPDGSGGPNSGMGFEGKSLSNPWGYVLMMEGTALFAGSLSKQLSANNTGKAVFPFTAGTSSAGYATASNEDRDGIKDSSSRGEIWLPIWENLATYKEIKYVFNEGRIQLGKKHAKTGTEFARAIISLGTERGISKFQRFCILKRKGKCYLFTNAGKITVADEPVASLLDELDKWYNPIIKQSKKNASEKLVRLVKSLDESIMKFCTYRKKQNLLQLLIMIGRLERYISGDADFEPLQKLSDRWLVECYDGSAEFRLAASIASIKHANGVGSIRENLENVIQKNDGWKHKKNSIPFVWKEDDNLLKNMSRVLQRRSLDGKIKSHDIIPIKGIIPAKINDIAKFLNGDLDTRKISDLILPLSIVDVTPETEYSWKNNLQEDISLPLPEAYMIMKLIHPSDEKENIPYDMSVLNLLFAGLIDNAYAKTAYMLHAHGLSPLRYSKKTGNAKSTSLSDVVKEYLVASLLFPISGTDRKLMLKSVIVDHTWA